jgi:hypothetical protein
MYLLKAADWPAEGESLKLTVTIYQEISGLPENKTSELRNVRFFSVEIRSFDRPVRPRAGIPSDCARMRFALIYFIKDNDISFYF